MKKQILIGLISLSPILTYAQWSITDPVCTNSNVGIGTNNPSSYGHGGTNKYLEINNQGTTMHSQSHVILSSGVSTIAGSSLGTISWIQPNVSTGDKGIGLIGMVTDSDDPSAPAGKMLFYTRSATNGNWNQRMMIASNGNVGIGTTLPEYPLDVVGSIRAYGLKLNLDKAADYVFAKDYKLASLSEVDAFIQVNKHLPGVPSAEQFRKNGMDVSEMNNLMLQKMEEMTLYMIQLKKENDALKAKMDSVLKK